MSPIRPPRRWGARPAASLMTPARWSLAVFLVSVVTLAGCASGTPVSPSGSPTSSAEVNPAGDIPDNQVYVPVTPPGASFTVKVPEGWAQAQSPDGLTFRDKLNSITLTSRASTTAPSVGSAQSSDVPAVASATPGVAATKVSAVTRASGPVVLITYTAPGVPDPVTGKSVRDAVERYEFWRAGIEVVITLAGPVGADNVDPWRIVTDSLRWL